MKIKIVTAFYLSSLGIAGWVGFIYYIANSWLTLAWVLFLVFFGGLFLACALGALFEHVTKEGSRHAARIK